MGYYMTRGYKTVGTRKRKFEYRTLKLTPYHDKLRATYPGATTYWVDPEKEWPFGTYMQVVAKGPKKKPSPNQP